ncbi:hypothetical protein DUNSADRAFT_18344 [Dunaliella salina]|uniref:Encoded protein n=1 Tax=Dunaliella salina TaxID=3046 RepID=A0ABQ7G0A6_DUNSA|nr:hypothetical protein DUNSADRAFT_18344 [Dunaliella salina]|eukprot:KAF5828034.1 hypothetical protein DUNSADRAFT_18344 [Dunaliella salina]
MGALAGGKALVNKREMYPDATRDSITCQLMSSSLLAEGHGSASGQLEPTPHRTMDVVKGALSRAEKNSSQTPPLSNLGRRTRCSLVRSRSGKQQPVSQKLSAPEPQHRHTLLLSPLP